MTMDARRARECGYIAPGEVAGLLGVSPRTVHFYEEMGLVSPRRSSRGTRFYTEADLRRLEVCVRLACLGVPLRTVRDLIEARVGATTGAEYGRALSDTLAEMRARFREDVRALRDLLAALEEVEGLVRRGAAGPGAAARPGGVQLSTRISLALMELVSSTPADDPDADDPAGGEPCADGARGTATRDGHVARTAPETPQAADAADVADAAEVEVEVAEPSRSGRSLL
ncbi:MerR family transcriptional regulator [Pseudonocardia endophytica]|uniref:DNA-binding transcriptional MerR regulator n=1 Tax=Pseudonocardia endophytica TaxID=401976 RepID=A0A4R1HJW9_PSEEN|nr:MerR family transcriptional regulator [Pseudonocardia endophytica]TCK21301.1 DNA-binding transcriptional MerR regulator [Pseudonocardia endophytica]